MGKGLTESIRVCYILTMRIKDKPDDQSRPTFTEAARRTQIIACAIETLATLGYAQASLAHIAQRAGISKGVIVYYFSSKEELYQEGRIRAIGVCNFPPDRLMDLMVHHQVVPAVNQVETHPFNQQIETQKFLQENHVQMESWGPFAEGKHNIFENELLRSIAGKYQKTVAQVIVRWLTQRGVVAIPKSVRKERIVENFNIFDFDLSPEDMAAMRTLDTKTSSFFDHRDPNIVKALSEATRPT